MFDTSTSGESFDMEFSLNVSKLWSEVSYASRVIRTMIKLATGAEKSGGKVLGQKLSSRAKLFTSIKGNLHRLPVESSHEHRD
jgi:hypothetical protein